MAATIDSALGLQFDVPMPAPKEKGYAVHAGPSLAWGAVNVDTTRMKRAYFLPPIQSQPASGWATTTTPGTVYARKRLSDFVAAGGVTEFEWALAGNYWLRMNQDGSAVSDGAGWTGGASGNLRKNPWLCFEWWAYGLHATDEWVCRLDWGGTSKGFRLYLSGGGWGQLAQNDGTGTYVTRAEGRLFPEGNATHTPAKILIAPMCRRCLYVFSPGAELLWEDTSIDPTGKDATDPDAASPLVEAGGVGITALRRMDAQISEAAFPATGSMAAPMHLSYAPAANGIEFSSPYGDSLEWKDVPAGTSLTVSAKTAAGAAWTADGTAQDFYLWVNFASDAAQRRTPVFYGTGLRVRPTTDTRDDNSDSILDSVLQGSTLEVQEDRSTLTLQMKDADGYREKLNRFVLLKADDDEVCRGFSSGSQWDVKNTLNAATFTVQDEWKRLDKILMPGDPFDGWKLTDAVKSVLQYAGYGEERWDIEDSDFRLPVQGMNHQQETEGGTERDDMSLMAPGLGTPCSDYLRHLVDTYGNWKAFFGPVDGTVKFRLRDFDDPSAPVATLYTTLAAAAAAGKGIRDVARTVEPSIMEPEANEIHVYGQAPGGGVLRAEWPGPGVPNPDADPTTPEASRSPAWVGEPRIVILIDPNLNTQEMCTRAAAVLVARLTRAIKRIEFTCEWRPEIGRYDWVTLDGDGTYRVTSFSMTLGPEDAGGHPYRAGRYTAERYL